MSLLCITIPRQQGACVGPDQAVRTLDGLRHRAAHLWRERRWPDTLGRVRSVAPIAGISLYAIIAATYQGDRGEQPGGWGMEQPGGWGMEPA